MKFKDTTFGDLTGKRVIQDIKIRNSLISLEGSPKEINGNFDIQLNELISLEWSPEIVDGDFLCSYNKLKTLKGIPTTINGYFNCNNNYLTSLEGSPEIVNGNFSCKDNQLINLKGNLKKVYGNLDISWNNIKDIKKEIIENQIEAIYYVTDEGGFPFETIQEDFEKYGNYLLKKEQMKINKELSKKIKKNKPKINTIDYGLSI